MNPLSRRSAAPKGGDPHREAGGPRGRIRPIAAVGVVLCLLLCLWPLAACRDAAPAEPTADYGDYGARAAERLAARWPNREAGSDTEREAADYIVAELEAMGYRPERQPFQFIDVDETAFRGENVLVRIPGTGFVTASDDGEDTPAAPGAYFTRQVLLLARMDTVPDDEVIRAASVGDVPAQGIHDNASGVGTVLNLARQLRAEQMGYDILLAFTSAGSKQSAGSQALLQSMDQAEIDRIDAVYEVRSIYAGDKMYAHSGHNSLVPDQHYRMRRKLYEVIDISMRSGLIRATGERLHSNQAGFLLDSAHFGSERLPDEVVYREVTLNESDYRVFDALDIPCVYFESYDYDGRALEEMVESRNPFYEETKQTVRGTNFDRIDRQEQLTGPTVLEDRINTLTYILLEAMKKPPEGGVKITD